MYYQNVLRICVLYVILEMMEPKWNLVIFLFG